MKVEIGSFIVAMEHGFVVEGDNEEHILAAVKRFLNVEVLPQGMWVGAIKHIVTAESRISMDASKMLNDEYGKEDYENQMDEDAAEQEVAKRQGKLFGEAA